MKQNLLALRAAHNKFNKLLIAVHTPADYQSAVQYTECQTQEMPQGMFEGIKQAAGVLGKKTESLKTKTGEVLADHNKQMER